jgi:hypothetical protein
LALTLDRVADGLTAGKKWNTELLAYFGAILGTAGGCMYEICEAITHDMGEVEPFAQIVAEISVSTLATAALFAGISVIRNRRLSYL